MVRGLRPELFCITRNSSSLFREKRSQLQLTNSFSEAKNLAYTHRHRQTAPDCPFTCLNGNIIFNLLEFLCLLLALSSTASLGPHGANMISSTTLIYMSDKYKYTFKSTNNTSKHFPTLSTLSKVQTTQKYMSDKYKCSFKSTNAHILKK